MRRHSVDRRDLDEALRQSSVDTLGNRVASSWSPAERSTSLRVDRYRYAIRSIASKYVVAAINKRVTPEPPKAQLEHTEEVGM